MQRREDMMDLDSSEEFSGLNDILNEIENLSLYSEVEPQVLTPAVSVGQDENHPEVKSPETKNLVRVKRSRGVFPIHGETSVQDISSIDESRYRAVSIHAGVSVSQVKFLPAHIKEVRLQHDCSRELIFALPLSVQTIHAAHHLDEAGTKRYIVELIDSAYLAVIRSNQQAKDAQTARESLSPTPSLAVLSNPLGVLKRERKVIEEEDAAGLSFPDMKRPRMSKRLKASSSLSLPVLSSSANILKRERVENEKEKVLLGLPEKKKLKKQIYYNREPQSSNLMPTPSSGPVKSPSLFSMTESTLKRKYDKTQFKENNESQRLSKKLKKIVNLKKRQRESERGGLLVAQSAVKKVKNHQGEAEATSCDDVLKRERYSLGEQKSPRPEKKAKFDARVKRNTFHLPANRLGSPAQQPKRNKPKHMR